MGISIACRREAVINAVCHREYDANGSIQIRLYDDELDIWNPGSLLMPLTPERLLQKHPSVPRNKLIANSLFYAGLLRAGVVAHSKLPSLLRKQS